MKRLHKILVAAAIMMLAPGIVMAANQDQAGGTIYNIGGLIGGSQVYGTMGTTTVPYQTGLVQIPFEQFANTYTGTITGNIFQVDSHLENQNPNAQTVAVFGQGVAQSGNAWGGNFVGYSTGATAIGTEVDFGKETSAGNAYGLVIASAGSYPPNAAIQIQSNNAQSIPQYGLVFNNNGGWMPTNQIVWLSGAQSGYLNYNPSTQKWYFKNGAGINVASIDSNGNMILKGTLTQNGNP